MDGLIAAAAEKSQTAQSQ